MEMPKRQVMEECILLLSKQMIGNTHCTCTKAIVRTKVRMMNWFLGRFTFSEILSHFHFSSCLNSPNISDEKSYHHAIKSHHQLCYRNQLKRQTCITECKCHLKICSNEHMCLCWCTLARSSDDSKLVNELYRNFSAFFVIFIYRYGSSFLKKIQIRLKFIHRSQTD